MTIAAKHFDPQLGIDIHLTVVPPLPTPIPLPTPHIGIVLDPFDYLPFIGNEIHVNGVKSATAGTGGLDIHIPLGAWLPTLKMPAGPQFEDELFMGSMTVLNSGEPFARVAMPVLDCNFIGMIPPFRLRKPKKPKLSMSLPTAINIAIPASVFIGGPPTISLQAMAFKAAFKLLGKAAKRGAPAFKKLRQKMFANLSPGFLKCKVLRAEPVDIRDGSVSVTHEDFSIPGRLPLAWTRAYSSNHVHAGTCGYGWQTPADLRLELQPDGSVMFVDTDSIALFPHQPTGEGREHAVLELVDGARLTRGDQALWVQTKAGLRYAFACGGDNVVPLQARSLPIERIEDLCGNHWRFERNDGHLVRIVESGGDGLQGRFVEVESRRGRIERMRLHDPATGLSYSLVSYEYSSEGCLVTARDALEAPLTFEYVQRHMVRHTDRVGLSFYYGYDKEWRVVRAWGDGGLHDYKFRYDDLLNEIEITDSLGHVSIVKFDENQLPLCEIDPLDGVTIFEYDEAGRTTAVVDPKGLCSRFEYDVTGNLLKFIRPDGSVLQMQYDERNHPALIVDPLGECWTQQWDERGLLLSQSSPLGAVLNYEYDRFGQLRHRVDPRGGMVRLEYDRNGLIGRLVDAAGQVVRFEHNALGLLVRETAPSGRATAYDYDAQGRLLRVVRPEGGTELCRYDAQGRLVEYIDEDGTLTRLEYFGTGLVAKRVQADGHAVGYHYDTEQRFLGVTNQRGETYRLSRDALGRIDEETDFWGQSRRYRYDAAGHLLEATDPLGRAIKYRTDALGRILEKQLPAADRPGCTAKEIFRYDARGQLIEMRNSHRHVQRKFDRDGRVVEEAQDGFAVLHAYDAAGNRIGRETSAGNRIAFAYDVRGQIASIAINDEAPIVIERDSLGRAVREKLSERVQRELHYDERGQLTAQTVLRDETRLFETAYEYDRSGNLIERSDSEQGADRYTYDPMGRILSHTDPAGRIAHFANDPVGDRLGTEVFQARRKQAVGADSGIEDDWSREGRYEGVRYIFDRAGNLTQRDANVGSASSNEGLQLRWDANHRLIESRKGGSVMRYGYDPHGRRVFKRDSTHTTWFYWDGDVLLAESRLLNEPARDAEIEFGMAADLLKALKHRQAFAGLHESAREYVYYPGSFVPLALIDKQGARQESPATVPKDIGSISAAAPSGASSICGSSQRESTAVSGQRERGADSKGSMVFGGLALGVATRTESPRPVAAEEAPVSNESVSVEPRVPASSGFGALGQMGLGAHEQEDSPAKNRPAAAPAPAIAAGQRDALMVAVLYPDTGLASSTPHAPANAPASDASPSSDMPADSGEVLRSVVFHYHVDPNGCPTRLTDARGRVVWSVSRAAWGGISQRHAQLIDNPIGFQGQYQDAETGLCYNRHRYYDPHIGQYISQDPIRLAGGLNTYAYGVNPTGWVDALGLACDTATPGASKANTPSTVTVFRVQGGTPPAASRIRIKLDADGNPKIQNGTLNISVGSTDHAQHFLSLRPGAHLVQFEIPTWMHDFIRENAIPQAGYKSNPLNQGGLAPKIVDPTTPGLSYELPPIWSKWLEEVAIPGSGKIT